MDKDLAEEIAFGQWLRQRRRILDLTQQELADQVGCARITLRRIEAGTLKPSKELAKILLEKLDTPLTERETLLRSARGVSGYLEHPIDPSASRLTTNLPTLLTTFIGREKEQGETINLISKNRLVTLAGAGGIGKTRLSVQVGREVLDDYPNGVWFAAFDSLADPALVPTAVAAVFDIREGSSDRPLIERLIYSLQAKTTLLILDNCEHLLDACAQLIKNLLIYCPNLKVLATSREVLGLEGEAVYYVPPLSAPTRLGSDSTESLAQYESIQLFIHRAKLAQSHYSMTAENASFLVQICQRLDGIPLAIELAAAQVDILQLKEMLKQLNEHFDLLVSNIRGAVPRHQTMRASLDWSWSLLTEVEQKFMQQLSVFAGGWILESAQAVCEGDILDLTSALVKKSLVVVNQERRHETRYRLHEIVRQYTREKLIESGEEENIHTRHLKFFLQFSEQSEVESKGPMQMEWYARLHLERDNIRAALDWADKTDIEAGMYICGRLGPYWDKFDISEGLRWLNKFSHKPESFGFPHARATVLCQLAWSLQWMEQFDHARDVAQECLELYRNCGDKLGEVDALTVLGTISSWQTRSDLKFLKQALSQAQFLQDRWRQAQIFSKIGGLMNSYPKRVSYWEKAISLFREVGDFFMACGFTIHLADFEMSWGNFESASLRLKEALRLNQERSLGGEKNSYFLSILGRISSINGDFEQARVYLQAAIDISEDQGHRMNILWLRTNLGYLALREGNTNEAFDLFAQTAPAFQKDKNLEGTAFTLEGIAAVYVEVNKLNQAARIIGWADSTRKEIGDTRPLLEQAEVDKIIAACLAKMGEVAFSDAYEEGQKMTLDEAVSHALRKG